jgi:hypothetical protein
LDDPQPNVKNAEGRKQQQAKDREQLVAKFHVAARRKESRRIWKRFPGNGEAEAGTGEGERGTRNSEGGTRNEANPIPCRVPSSAFRVPGFAYSLPIYLSVPLLS